MSARAASWSARSASSSGAVISRNTADLRLPGGIAGAAYRLTGSRHPGCTSTSARPPAAAASTPRYTTPARSGGVCVDSATASTMAAPQSGSDSTGNAGRSPCRAERHGRLPRASPPASRADSAAALVGVWLTGHPPHRRARMWRGLRRASRAARPARRRPGALLRVRGRHAGGDHLDGAARRPVQGVVALALPAADLGGADQARRACPGRGCARAGRAGSDRRGRSR